MIWSWFRKPDHESRARAMRRAHSRFLSAAIDSAHMFPRIPVRRVDRGGFGPMMARPRGRAVAEAWWRKALDALPDETDG